MENKRTVYLDYSATTPVKEDVLKEMLPYFTEHFGNPSSLYTIGLESKDAITVARERLAALIGAEPNEVYFTGSGSEADNWSLFGISDIRSKKGKHIITSRIEHHAILHSCEFLEKHGYEVTYLDVDSEGFVSVEDVKAAIRPDTVLISIMLVNNEVGTVEPIKEIAEIAHEYGIIMHTDAVQGLGNVPIDVKDLDVDLMSMSGHKIYGPKGIGAMYIKKGTRIPNYIHGGAQENNKRAGTENLAGIVGFGKAAEIAMLELDKHRAHSMELRDYMVNRILDEIPNTYFNGPKDTSRRHPGNANITFEYIEGESMLILLDGFGISVSTGSACSSKSLNPSHVLTALGIPVERIHGSIRLTVGDMTTREDVDYVVDSLKQIVSRLREISPISEKKGW